MPILKKLPIQVMTTVLTGLPDGAGADDLTYAKFRIPWDCDLVYAEARVGHLALGADTDVVIKNGSTTLCTLENMDAVDDYDSETLVNKSFKEGDYVVIEGQADASTADGATVAITLHFQLHENAVPA